MTYQIGQIVPFTGSRGIWRGNWYDNRPRWFIFNVPPMGELPAESWLIRNGAMEAWHPVVPKWRIAGPAHNRKKVPYNAPSVSGYVFAMFDREPHWDVLMERSNRKLARVEKRGELPLAIDERIIEQMAQVPERMKERLQAIAEAKRIRPGDTATLDPGSALAWTVEVTAVHGEMATLIIPLLGGHETTVPVARLEKLA